MKSMKERNTFACGTVCVNCGELPNDFNVGKLDCGISTFACDDGTAAVHWKDKWDVFMMSSWHGNNESLVDGKTQW